MFGTERKFYEKYGGFSGYYIFLLMKYQQRSDVSLDIYEKLLLLDHQNNVKKHMILFKTLKCGYHEGLQVS